MTTNISQSGWAKVCGFVCLLTMSLLLTNSASAVDLSGCWSGTWESCTCRHHGPLNATFTKCGDSQYLVAFRGRFFKIMPFHYTVTLNVIEDGDTVKLAGSSYLGRIMGTFTYNATANATSFNSQYTSCKDWGYFRLTRCCSTVAVCNN